MALSMEEQRILAEMERNLAAEDPRLASRLSSFGQQKLPGTLRSQRVRTIAGLLALAMIAAVTITMFMLSPYVNGRHGDIVPRTHASAGTSSPPRLSMSQHASAGKSGSSTDTAKSGKTGTAGASKQGTAKTGAKSSSARTGSLHTASKTGTSGHGSR